MAHLCAGRDVFSFFKRFGGQPNGPGVDPQDPPPPPASFLLDPALISEVLCNIYTLLSGYRGGSSGMEGSCGQEPTLSLFWLKPKIYKEYNQIHYYFENLLSEILYPPLALTLERQVCADVNLPRLIFCPLILLSL